MADLIDQTTLGNMLLAGGITLTSAQSAVLPQITAAVSRAIRRWCSRQLTQATYDELYTVPLDGQVLLREWPVDSVARCATGPATVLTITNTSTTVNQRAQVQLQCTGDVGTGLVPTGLALQLVASGVVSTATVTFTANMTVQALATAVTALGNGWSATADSAYGLWPVADLRAVQGYLPAVTPQQAELKIHTTDLPFDIDEKAGILVLQALNSSTTNPWRSTRWGPPLATSWGDQQLGGQFQGLRVVYTAGLAVIPEDIQQAAALTVADWLRLLALDPRLLSEKAGDYEYQLTATLAQYHLPASVLGMLSTYRSQRV